MKTFYLLFSAFILTLTQSLFAQNLVFDSTFNNGNPHLDPSFNDIYFTTFGSMEQLNDSMFVYFSNYADYNAFQVFSHVTVKTVHSNGAVTSENIINRQNFYSGFYDPSIYSITDIVVNNNRVFVISNQPYDDNGTTKFGIYIEALDYDNGSFVPSTWIGGLVQFNNANISSGKGAARVDNSTLIIAVEQNSASQQLAVIHAGSAGGQISYTTPIVLTNNTAGSEYSIVADIILVSATEAYIADNAYSYTNSGGNYTYNDNARIIKYNPNALALSVDYTANGAGFSATMNWNTQTNTPSRQDRIRRIVHSNGKILVAGENDYYDGSPYNLGRGRITRLNANGTIDNTFAPNSSISGTFAQSLTSSYFRWWFTDLDVKSDGKLFISAYGTFSTSSPQDPIQCFFLQLDSDGNLDTGVGNNGFLFENAGYSEINETIIIPGSSPTEDKFILNGIYIINPDPFNGEVKIALGRLGWTNSNASNECAITNIDVIDISCNTKDAYTATLEVFYENEPSSGKLNVANIEFDITGSPQTVILNNLSTSNAGNTFTSQALFSADFDCSYALNNAWTIPDCSSLGLHESNPEDILEIFPNPTNAILSIETTHSMNVVFVNLLGETVIVAQLKPGTNSIDVSDLQTGVYFIKSAKNSISRKFVKQ